MLARDFAFWLQGYFEIEEAARQEVTLSSTQVQVIRKHLALVFRHEIDPSMGDEARQEDLLLP